MHVSTIFARALLFSFPALTVAALSQQTATPCGKPPIILQSTEPNIFSEQQEQWLGEAMADYFDHDIRQIKNPALNTYLNTIGSRLLAALPPTTMQFHYTLVESSEVNGFSIAGGRVYITSKLVASAHSEDEIAGVIAHELGHILTHQFAIETTADLRRLLGVTSVSDRADIYAKFQRLVDARMHQKHQTDVDSDDKQDQADRVAVYAAATAGYRPQAYAEFWDRSFFVGGKTGSRLSDFFGATSPSQKRLRKIRGIIAELPPGCGTTKEAKASPEFEHWQHDVLEDQAAPVTAASTSSAVSDLQLTPPLRLDIDRVRFSRDGKYVLAQDQSSIFVLTREPFKELFRIDAERALPADFTPDSQQVAFTTPGLHVEQWSISQQKLLAAHEVVAQQDCIETLLSPDARTVACVVTPSAEHGVGFVLIDVDTGHLLFEKKSWFDPNLSFEYALLQRLLTHDTSDIVTAAFSADGNTLLIGPGSDRLAFDLRTRTPIKIEGALKQYAFPVSYCFLGNDKVVAVNPITPDESGIFSFPDGKRLQKIKLNLPYMSSTTGGELVITAASKDLTAGSKDAAVAVADVSAARYVVASRSPAIDVFGSSTARSFVSESLDGSLALTKPGSQDPKDTSHTLLSLSPLAPANAASLSPDGRYLAFSTHTRGGVWDLQTGKRAFYVRGFRSAWWTPEGKLLAEFSAHDKDLRVVGEMTMVPQHADTLSYKLADKAYLESGHLYEWKSEKKTWTLITSSPLDASVQWSKSFNDGHPSSAINQADDDLIYSYALQSSLAKDKLRNAGNLKDEINAVKEKGSGRLIEIVSSSDGSTRAQVVVEVPRTYEGVDGFTRVGDLLYLSTGDNRTIVYSIKDGSQLRQIFGNVVAADPATGAICTTNRRGEAVVLDKAGVELQHLTLGSPLRLRASAKRVRNWWSSPLTSVFAASRSDRRSRAIAEHRNSAEPPSGSIVPPPRFAEMKVSGSIVSFCLGADPARCV